MNESRPSVAVAIWLLQHVGGSNPREDALTGDLLESMAEGQTAGWLVREVSIAIAHRLSKKIRVYWQELGTVALGTSITLSSADAQWRGQWVDSCGVRSSNIIPVGPRSPDIHLPLRQHMEPPYRCFFGCSFLGAEECRHGAHSSRPFQSPTSCSPRCS